MIGGFTPNVPNYVGTMPARDATFTVIYTANPRPAPQPEQTEDEPEAPVPIINHVPYEILGDYDTPLGIPSLSMNTGEVFE